MKKKIRKIIPVCILATVIPASAVQAMTSKEIMEEVLPVEFTGYEAIGDGYVLLQNYESGFSDAGFQYGVYDYINQKWLMEYRELEDPLEDAEYVGEGKFAYSSGNNTLLIKPDEQEIVDFDLPVNIEDIHFYNGYALVKAREDEADSDDIFVVNENGDFYCTGIADFIANEISDDGTAKMAYLWTCCVDQNYAVFAYDDTDFIIYDIQNDSIKDIYNTEYAEKLCDGTREELGAAVCGDDSLALLNMEGNDGKNYYAVLDFDGNTLVEATECDYASVSEKGNLIVKNGDQTEEVKVADIQPEKAQTPENLVLVSSNQDARDEKDIGMDRKGSVYKNTIEYKDIFYLDNAPSYDQADTWYLGGNYSKFHGTWYFPEGTKEDGFVNVRLVGDENVIYESDTINAQNASADFDVDVSGIKELRLEYSGSADLNDLLLGLADAEYVPTGVQENTSSDEQETDSGSVQESKDNGEADMAAEQKTETSTMLYDLHAYVGGFNKTDIINDNMGNTYYNAITASDYEEDAIYDIGKKYSTLTGILAVTKADLSEFDQDKTGYVRIYGDGALLWENSTINTKTKPYEFTVDISGVTDLEVKMCGFSVNLSWDFLGVILENVRLQ